MPARASSLSSLMVSLLVSLLLVPAVLLICAFTLTGCASASDILIPKELSCSQLAERLEQVNAEVKGIVDEQKLPLSALVNVDIKTIVDSADRIPAMKYKLEQWRLRTMEGIHVLSPQVKTCIDNLIEQLGAGTGEEVFIEMKEGAPCTEYFSEKKGEELKQQITGLCSNFFSDSGLGESWSKIVADYNAYELSMSNIQYLEPKLVNFSSTQMVEWFGEFYTNLWINQMKIAEMAAR